MPDVLVGSALFCMGVASVCALLLSSKILEKFEPRKVLLGCASLASLALILTGLSASFEFLAFCFALFGISIAIGDVAMNSVAIHYEIHTKERCMNFFHAFYSFGAVMGSALGAFFAYLSLGAAPNFITLAIPLGICAFIAEKYLVSRQSNKADSSDKSKTKYRPGLFIVLCALLALLAYAIEGSVAEWGSIFMVDEKGATQSLAALVYGSLSIVTFSVRMVADKIRKTFGDFKVLICSCLLTFVFYSLVLYAPSARLTLASYCLLGVSLAPMFPIVMSIVGMYSKDNIEKNSAFVAIGGYSGMLAFPPSLGWLATHFTLGRALLLVVFFCFITFCISSFLSFLFKKYSQKM